ncbi:DUF5666 domain-containing protein [Aromatoleum diolicum]|uniref:DUF5666 domain-containing protein n=1 Tax=Aromatoleum diolicum TaxID=75796 RepID=UPI0031B61864
MASNPGGSGGTGEIAHGGIGGTGAPARDGGLGGTGIVGTITGFASICVNGVEVHYEEEVPVTENGVSSKTARLAVGQVVAVEAGTTSRGLEARNIAILNAYEGPLTSLPTASSPLRVMGQSVRLAPDAKVDAGLRSGEPVRVSGLRSAQGEVVATRIERAPDMRDASAIGAIDRKDSLLGLALSGKAPADGRELLVRGTWTGTTLQVTQARNDPSIPFAGRVRDAIVEGLVLDRLDNRVMISGFSVELDGGTAFSGGEVTDLNTNRRVRVSGVFSGTREVKATHIEFVRDGSESRGGGQRGKSGAKSDGHEDEDEDSRSGSGKSRVDTDDGRIRIETEDESGRERIERSVSATGEIEREKIERRVENADGELLRRERLEVRTSGDRTEIRERVEIFNKGERIDRVERIDRIEKPERVDRPPKIERPEKIERPDHD